MTSNELLHSKSKILDSLLKEFDDKTIQKALKKAEKNNFVEPSKYNKKVKFCILLDEIVQYKRPRANFRRKRIYDPPESAEFKEMLMQKFFNKAKSLGYDFHMIDKPIRIVMNIYINPPKNTSKIDRYLMEIGLMRPSVRPDIDNYMKNIFDSMNAVLMKDDGQVISYSGDKFYSSVCRLEFILSYNE